MSRAPSEPAANVPLESEFKRGLGFLDSTMVVAGSMIGVGIFTVSSAMARQVGRPGWLLLSWVITSFLTLTAALSYGELAAMMPFAGGQYVYLREAFSPICGFLYGWTLFLTIQTGTIAAVAVGFARYCGVLWPSIAENRYLIAPIHLSQTYAISLSSTQFVGILLIILLTWANSLGIDYGKIIQNVFTTSKIGLILAIIIVGLVFAWNPHAVHDNFANLWGSRGITQVAPGITTATVLGGFVAMCIAQTGSLFAADAWNNITFIAAELKDPRRNIPLSLSIGTGIVMLLYFLTNLAYLLMLPIASIENAPSDRVASYALSVTFPGIAASFVAIGVIVSSFGCVNGLVLAGSRAYYAMAKNGLFFTLAARLNPAKVPASGLALQAIWASFLVTMRTYNPQSGTYGNVYTDLLEYVVAVELIFYVLTVLSVFKLRSTRPNAYRPYRVFAYPVLPILYIIGAGAILIVLFIYQPTTSWPGLLIVISGIPVFWIWRKRSNNSQSQSPPSLTDITGSVK
jgi:basic amino acid/polyamine antiporter, APA family